MAPTDLPGGRAALARAAAALLVVALFGLPLFHGLGNADLKGDEPIYAFAVDRMLENGDWLNPRSIPSDTVTFLEKPPLKFWIVALSMRAGLIPHDEFGHRFWDAVFGLVTFLYVFAIGRLAGGFVCGFIAVLVLFLHRPLLFEHGLRSANMEAPLVLAYAASLAHALWWARTDEGWRRWWHPLACGLWFVLGFMTKFAAAIFLPAVLMLTALLVPAWRRRAWRDRGPWAVSALVAIAAIVPWFVYQAVRDPDLWRIILREHVVQRMTSYIDPAHVQPWSFYFVELRVMLDEAPIWGSTLVLVLAGLLLVAIRTIRTRWDVGTLVLLWIVVPLAAISLGSSKLYHYLYPFLPPLALAAGYFVAVLVDPNGPVRSLLTRLVDRLTHSRPVRRIAEGPPMLRLLMTGLGVAALAAAFVRVVYGPIRLPLGVGVLRVGALSRPIAAGVLLLTLAGRGALVTGPLLVPLVLLTMPVAHYRQTVASLDEGDQRLRDMGRCLVDVQAAGAPRGVYAPAVPDRPWGFLYYFRDAGYQDLEPGEDDLPAWILDPASERPLLLKERALAAHRTRLETSTSDADAEAARRLASVPGVPLGYGEVLLLPGRYTACAVRFSEVRHDR